MQGQRIRLSRFLLILMIAIAFQGLTISQEVTAEPDDVPAQNYTVQPGDTLYRIALRFDTTTIAIAEANGITNTREIFSGQVLVIPGDADQQQQPTEPPFPRPGTVAPDVTSGTYVVRTGDTLYRIAIANGTTVAELVAANNLPNPNTIYAGQVLTIPGSQPAPVQATAAPTDAPAQNPETPTSPTQAPVELDVVQETVVLPQEVAFAYGVQAYFGGLDAANVAQSVTEFGADWVRVRVDWGEIEVQQGAPDFSSLDMIVDALGIRGLNILLTVVDSPLWARDDINENGPPRNVEDFAGFTGVLASRYAGRVDAYQIWDEPNLRRNWHCDMRLCELEYTDLLRPAFAAIKAADSSAMVVTAGIAPSGFNDGVNAINDRLYLTRMYQTGVNLISDAIGVHAPGWANPPDARCCTPSNGVLTHFEDTSFYFIETIEAYREVMVANNDAGTSMWVTRFGWGTNADLGPLPIVTDTAGNQVENPNVFVTYIDLAQQAIYAERAYEIGRELGYIGPMFLDNLNACQAANARSELCFYSAIGPETSVRPLLNSVPANAGENPVSEPSPEATNDPMQ